MEKTTTPISFIAKLLILLSLSFIINTVNTSAQIVIENKMPETSQFESIKTKIGGLIILNGFFDIRGGLNDQPSFNLAQIDVFKANTFNAFNMHMRLSILRIVNEFKLKNGETITTKIEGDFNGTKSFETTPAFKLRHINVKYKGWLIGQDWSTFSDIGVLVNTLDADGPSIGLGLRKPVIRYTFNHDNPLKVDLALEQPLIDYRLPTNNSDSSWSKVKQVTPYFPELVGAIEYTFGQYMSHVRFASVFRKISYLDKDDHTKHATSWGASLSSKINLNEVVGLIVQGNLGKGIGIYTSSFGGSGYDGFVSDNQLKTIPAFGGFAAVELRYTKNSPLSSTFAIGYSRIKIDAKNNTEITSNGYYGNKLSGSSKYDSKYNKLDIGIPYASANLMYRVFENFTLGAEVNWGGKTLISKSDQSTLPVKEDSKKALRVTFGMIYKI